MSRKVGHNVRTLFAVAITLETDAFARLHSGHLHGTATRRFFSPSATLLSPA